MRLAAVWSNGEGRSVSELGLVVSPEHRYASILTRGFLGDGFSSFSSSTSMGLMSLEASREGSSLGLTAEPEAMALSVPSSFTAKEENRKDIVPEVKLLRRAGQWCWSSAAVGGCRM